MGDQIFMKIPQGWKDDQRLPLYKSLYNLIREMILSGELSAGVRLPASRILAKELSISRNTVTQAFEMLQADGFLLSRTGAGVFVSNDIVHDLFIPKVDTKKIRNKAPNISLRAKKLTQLFSDRNYKKNSKPFAPGRPALEEFPFDIWARLISRTWRLRGAELAMEEDPQGYLPLRQSLLDYLKESRGVRCHADQILIVSGAQQGLDLISRVLWDKEDKVVTEDPGFPGVEAVISSSGATECPLPIDQEGLRVDLVKHQDHVKSFLVTPSRNYPVGVTMSLSRRIALLEAARDHDAWVIEDDYDSDFRFDGRPLAALQGLDKEGRVIYIGTFSRIIFPALRLGFIVLPENLIDPFLAAKSYIDGHTSIVPQVALAEFFKEGHYASHLRRMRKLYKQRRQYLIDRLRQSFSDILEIMPSDGGLHLCVRFLQDKDDIVLTKRLEENGVTVRALSGFYRFDQKQSGMVLGFAGYDEKQMENALEILDEILRN